MTLQETIEMKKLNPIAAFKLLIICHKMEWSMNGEYPDIESIGNASIHGFDWIEFLNSTYKKQMENDNK